MKVLGIPILLVLATAIPVENKVTRCKGISINGINHEKEVIIKDVTEPYMMSIDYDTNVLYYTTTGTRGSSFMTYALNLKTGENYEISGIRGGFATSVDPKTHKTYIGGSDGIYDFDYQTKTTRKLNITSADIWQIFVKDVIYFTTFPNPKALVYKNGEVQKVPGIGDSKVSLLGLDRDNNILFSNSSGLHLLPKDGNDISYVGPYALNCITTNSNGNLFFSTPLGIYYVNEVTNNKVNISQLASIINVFGMAVESDGSIIYSSSNAIIRLKSTGEECIEEATELKQE